MSREISLAEVKKHTNEKSAWIIIDGAVYDVTKFAPEHPGGIDPLMDAAGRDGTQDFEDVGHSDDARKILKTLKVGILSPRDAVAAKLNKSCNKLYYALAALALALLIGYGIRRKMNAE